MTRAVVLAMAVAVALALALALAAIATGCDDRRAPAHERTLFFRGEPAAHVEERVEDDGLGKRVHRRVRLPHGEVVETTARLDAFGFVVEASYRRGARMLELRDGKLTRDATSLALDGAGAGAVVAVDMIRHVQPPSRTDVTLVDFASGEILAGKVDRQGASIVATDEKGGLIVRCNVEGSCTGPGAFFEGDTAPALDTAPIEPAFVAKGKPRALRLLGIGDVTNALALDGPGQRAIGGGTLEYVDDAARPLTAAPTDADRAPGLFIESDDAAVRAFAGKPSEALADAARIADAVFPLVDAAAKDQPPSATAMLASKGDCDGAAALVTASLRALGHAARPVVGYRFVDAPAERAQTMSGAAENAGGRFVPHAWVEVYTPTGWVLIDATVPRVGGAAQGYVKLFHGLGSALTMGRVLGRLRVEPATPATPAKGP